MVLRNKRAGLKEVAQLAGTSTATASRAISGRGYISETSRARVLQAVEQLSYQPNLQARGLRQSSSCTIGLVIPNLLNAYYTALADTLTTVLVEKGYHLLLAATRDDAEIEQNMLNDMISRAADGLLWVPSHANKELLDYLSDQHTPVVAIVRRVPDDALDAIIFEDVEGSHAATRHLITLGHERIAFIGGDVRHSSNYDRWQGYLDALHESGIEVDQNLVKIGSTWSFWGEVATNELLRLQVLPTAMFVASNAIMPGVIKTLRQNKVSLPDDMSLVCFDDLDWFSFSVPSVTAVTTNHVHLAEAAADLLLKRIEIPRQPDEPAIIIKIKSELILRESTVQPRKNSIGKH